MDTPKLSQTQVTELKERLPYGSIKKIATMLGLRPDYVSAVLNNLKPYNIKIIKAAIEIVENNAKESQDINERFNKLLSKIP